MTQCQYKSKKGKKLKSLRMGAALLRTEWSTELGVVIDLNLLVLTDLNALIGSHLRE